MPIVYTSRTCAPIPAIRFAARISTLPNSATGLAENTSLPQGVWYDYGVMQRSLAVWTRIVGILLVLLGVFLLVAPEVPYIRRERVLSTPSVHATAKRERVVVIPRPLAAFVVTAGVSLVLIARRPRD